MYLFLCVSLFNYIIHIYNVYHQKRADYGCNGQYYIVARSGDTYASLARVMNTKEKKLRQYNDVREDYSLREGDIVYLGKKRKKADRSMKRRYHVMEEGESLYTISQRYGIRLSSLCKMNPIGKNYHFRAGDEIKIK